MQTEPLSNGIGVIVSGIDVARGLNSDTITELRHLWLQHLVVFIRDQQLTPKQQMVFASQIGEPDTYPFLSGLPGYPQITEVLKKENETVNFGGVWHTDTIYQPCPPMATMLYAIEIPPIGGDTLFANQYAAFDALSDGLAGTLKSLKAVARAGNKAVAATRANRLGDQGTDVQAADLMAEHPVVRIHPETGRQSLYLSPAHSTQFSGWTEQESTALLKTLFTLQTQPEYTCRFRWQTGDIALWDNRCTLHYPINDYQGHRRLLHRITLKGDQPTG